MKKWQQIFLLALFFALSCKPAKDESSAKSLDNFAAGKKVQENSCGASPKHDLNGKRVSDQKKSARNASSRNLLYYSVKADYNSGNLSVAEYKELKSVARTVLTAIPGDIQELFLGQKGAVVITEAANKICTQDMMEHFKGKKQSVKQAELTSLAEGLSEIEGCYVFVPQRNGEEQIFDVYINASASSIKHGLVRVFGYLLAEFYSRTMPRNKSSSDLVLVKSEPAKSRAKKAALAKAFLKDVQGTEFEKRFKKYQSKSTPEDLRLAFANWIFAESFDSYYCNNWAGDSSENTRLKMAQDFKESFAIFEKEFLGKGFSLTANSSPSFQLAGGSNRKKVELESPWWAGVKTFFKAAPSSVVTSADRLSGYKAYRQRVKKSIDENYDPNKGVMGNAAGAVSDATGYSKYTNAVKKEVDENHDPSKNVLTNAVNASGQVVSDGTGYTEYKKQVSTAVQKNFDESGSATGAAVSGLKDVAVQKYDDYKEDVRKDIDARFEVAQKRGNSTDASAAQAFIGFAGSRSYAGGATQYYEAARGYDTKTGEDLSMEQVQDKLVEGAQNSLTTAGHIKSVQGAMEKAKQLDQKIFRSGSNGTSGAVASEVGAVETGTGVDPCLSLAGGCDPFANRSQIPTLDEKFGTERYTDKISSGSNRVGNIDQARTVASDVRELRSDMQQFEKVMKNSSSAAEYQEAVNGLRQAEWNHQRVMGAVKETWDQGSDARTAFENAITK